MNNTAWLCGLITLALCPISLADIIELKDGQKLSGNMVRQGNVVTITTIDGKVITARPDDVVKVTLTSSITPDDAAKAEWTRIAQQIKTADNLQTIIDLHQKFLDKYPNVAQAADVRAALEMYTGLSQNDGVKFRGRWIPKAQVDVVLKEWADAAKPAADLYRAGRMKDALEAARHVIAADPQNPDALTIAGLAGYRLGTLPSARTYFTNLAAADPTSVLAENNLAVVAFQQNQQGESISRYIKAMQVMPDNRLLLDNVAEAINISQNSNSPADRNAPNLHALQRLYDPAEARMEGEMSKKGLSRWGSTWVTREQKDAIEKNIASVKYQMASLEAKYKSVSDAAASLDAQIKQAGSDYDSAAALVVTLDAQMGLRGADINSLQFQRTNAAMNAERARQYKSSLETRRAQLIAGAGDFFAQANKLKADLASASSKTFSGTEHIMDLGDAENPPPPPVPPAATRPPTPPATAPASQPDPYPYPQTDAPYDSGIPYADGPPPYNPLPMTQRPSGQGYGIAVHSTPEGSTVTVFRNGGSQTTDLPGQNVTGAGISPGGATLRTR